LQAALEVVEDTNKAKIVKRESLSAAKGESRETFDSATGTEKDKKKKRVAATNLGKRTTRTTGASDETLEAPEELRVTKRARRHI
jgi:hypothetical protein